MISMPQLNTKIIMITEREFRFNKNRILIYYVSTIMISVIIIPITLQCITKLTINNMIHHILDRIKQNN